MKRHLIPVTVTAMCVVCSALSYACGAGEKKDAAADDMTGGEGANANGGKSDGGKKKEEEIKTQGQALRALLDFSAIQVAEAKVGASRTKTPEVKTLAEGIEADYTATTDRLKAISTDKGIKPAKNGMSDRLKFNSQSQLNHIQNIMPGMVDNAYLTRVQNAHKELLTQIDEAILPVVVDEDFKAEIAVMRDDAKRHMADASTAAEAAQSDAPPIPPLGGGKPPGGDAGFQGGPAEDPPAQGETPPADGEAPPAQAPPAEQGGGGDAGV